MNPNSSAFRKLIYLVILVVLAVPIVWLGRPSSKDADGRVVKVSVKAYEGKPRPLGYLAPAASANAVLVTSRRGVFRSTFTNGVLAAQWLRNVLLEDGRIDADELFKKS